MHIKLVNMDFCEVKTPFVKVVNFQSNNLFTASDRLPVKPET